MMDPESPPRRRRFPRSLIVLGVLIAAVAVLIAVWNWDWFIPLAERQASSAAGRPVKITHLHVHLGRITRVVADGVSVANPEGFPADSHFATADHLAAEIDLAGYVHDRSAVKILRVEVDHPQVDVADGPDGKPNYLFASDKPASSSSSGPTIAIGDLVITDGHATVKLPQYKTDTKLDIATREPSGDQKAAIVVHVAGTYAGQPIVGDAIGGALLSLRDAADPYPIDLKLANGATKVAIKGTIQDPLHFKGTDVTLDLSGPDMSKLYPLTGVPIPETPPYRITGKLEYADAKYKFTNFAGRVGRSDLEGTIEVDPGAERPKVTADLQSKLVNLDDLAGFIGTTPGAKNGTASGQGKVEASREASTGKLLPNVPINLPKVKAADVALKYKGFKIEGRSVPFDNVVANLTIQDGRIDLKPLSFAVGKGSVSADIDLSPASDKAVRMRADISFKQVDIGRLMATTHTFGGAGSIGGRAVIDGTGSSLAQVLGTGTGDLKLFASGGNLSALLVDLSGLQFGSAVLSAIGVPDRTQLRCMAIDMPLRHGVLSTNTLLVDTDESNVVGTGTIDLNREVLDYKLTTTGKHVSVGTISAPILIRGALRSPSILPDPAVIARKGVEMGVLGVLLTPLGALIPTIQLGLGEDNDCARVFANVGRAGANRVATPQVRTRAAGR